jgi:hypothetical protein
MDFVTYKHFPVFNQNYIYACFDIADLNGRERAYFESLLFRLRKLKEEKQKLKTLNFKNPKNKTVITLIAMLLMLSMTIATIPLTHGDAYPAPNTHFKTYSYLNVFPNPAGIGQQVTLGIFLSNVFPTSEVAINMYVDITDPNGKLTTIGPYTSDLTDGTVAYFTPDKLGNYTIVFRYGGQMLRNSTTYNNIWQDPSQSLPTTLVVQQEPTIQHMYPVTPLPNQWWQTPVSAENSQNWYTLTGAWLGLKGNDFASTGGYNSTGYYNPYTESVNAGHVLWTKPWLGGGLAGGINGNNEVTSHYWSTFQYTPRYAPVCINGILYSTQYTFGMATGACAGIVAMDLYTGETLWTINTTNALRCGSIFYMYTINDYGVRGPWLWTTGTLPACDTGGRYIASGNVAGSYMNTTGTQWNLYDGINGKYVMSVVNGSALTLGQDPNGDLIGYFTNSTKGTQVIHPTAGTTALATTTGTHITAVNMTTCMGVTSAMSPTNLNVNTIRAMQTGYIFDVDVPTNMSGVPYSPALGFSGITGDALVFTAGNNMWGTYGFITMASLDAWTGQFLGATNITYPGTIALLPWTREMSGLGDGQYIMGNCVNMDIVSYYARTCTKAWDTQLFGTNGATPNIYDLFQIKPYFGKGLSIWEALGGDIWAINTTTGKVVWYANTTMWSGPSGTETPYNIWPVWVFSSSCVSNDVGYFAGGHEYNPPLFHGAQLYAVNMTDGSLVWKQLCTSVTSTIIAYGKVVALNAYDNQLYCWGKGPSAITVQAPAIGVTTETPITITGSIMDVSPGINQLLVKSNFANGLPCVSDDSESAFMEAVYQQQQMPNNVTGVPITINVLDANNNFRTIGTATSDGTGHFGLTWTPDIPGNFEVIASFQGSNSYYPSSSITYFSASLPATTTAPTVTAQINVATTSDLMLYIVGAAIAIIIVMAIGFAFVLRKK